jgi:DNA-binding transcriptional LysR family regulator
VPHKRTVNCCAWEQVQTTQYIIPPLARFHQMQGIKVILRNGNTEQIESALLNKEIETGIVEGQSKIKRLNTPFLKDELVLVCNSTNHW